MSEKEQLERILGSTALASSPSLSRFLRYIVEETLAGRSAAIREYPLGVSVFERGPDFNPRLDPIVRVQARNLRARIARYYEGPGAQDPIRIELPKGTYVPVFHTQAVQAFAAPRPPATQHGSRNSFAGSVMPVPPPRSPVAEPRLPRYWVAAVILLIILAGIAAVYFTQAQGGPRVSRQTAGLLQSQYLAEIAQPA